MRCRGRSGEPRDGTAVLVAASGDRPPRGLRGIATFSSWLGLLMYRQSFSCEFGRWLGAVRLLMM